ncbi:MAG: ubiquinone/menaquinone biosynthesis methyltransferase [Dehalococcoidia bacterium]|nr:ubiquinone/menaquinone biosynthesis methyltransferase [Dehalococcoidia bacterium]
MFNRIARRYDLLNTAISGGMHHRWRRLAARMAVDGVPLPLGLSSTLSATKGKEEGLGEGSRALDVATGTGDFALALLAKGVPRVVGLDFLPSMIALAEAKARRKKHRARVSLVVGDALHLPFPPDSFQWVTSGFNMRNVADLELALAEMARVARPGGRVVILEITPLPPKGFFPHLFRWYFSAVTPLIGQLLAGDREAYTYLPSSVLRFPDAPALAKKMEAAGLTQVRYRLLGFGSTAVHVGEKPARE